MRLLLLGLVPFGGTLVACKPHGDPPAEVIVPDDTVVLHGEYAGTAHWTVSATGRVGASARLTATASYRDEAQYPVSASFESADGNEVVLELVRKP